MSRDNQDILARAYSRLQSLRQNLPGWVSERYAREYHDVLTMLENLGLDVAEFRIPESDITPMATTVSYIGGPATYSDDKYVDHQLILVKLDSIIGYFKLKFSEKPSRIGFHTPDTE